MGEVPEDQRFTLRGERMEIMGPLQGPKMLLARMPIQECSSIFSRIFPVLHKSAKRPQLWKTPLEKCFSMGLPLGSRGSSDRASCTISILD